MIDWPVIKRNLPKLLCVQLRDDLVSSRTFQVDFHKIEQPSPPPSLVGIRCIVYVF